MLLGEKWSDEHQQILGAHYQTVVTTTWDTNSFAFVLVSQCVLSGHDSKCFE